MICDMKFHPKAQNAKGKRVFLITLLLALALFLSSLLFTSYQGVIQLVALVLLTIALYFYNRYVTTSFVYEITTDADGAPVFVVSSYQGKRVSTLCRIALWDVTGVVRYTREELAKREKSKEVSTHKFTPTMSPEIITVISVRSTYEKCDLWLETAEDFDAYFLSVVKEAKELKSMENDE